VLGDYCAFFLIKITIIVFFWISTIKVSYVNIIFLEIQYLVFLGKNIGKCFQLFLSIFLEKKCHQSYINHRRYQQKNTLGVRNQGPCKAKQCTISCDVPAAFYVHKTRHSDQNHSQNERSRDQHNHKRLWNNICTIWKSLFDILV